MSRAWCAGGRARVAGLMQRVRDDERGVGMVMAFSVASIVFLLTLTWTGLAEHQVTLSAHERSSEQATQAAEAGVHRALSLVVADPDQSHPITGTGNLDQHGDVFGEFEFEVALVTGVNDPRRRITAWGWAPSRTSPRKSVKKLRVEVELTQGTPFAHALFAGNGNVTVGSGLNLTGDTYATGTVEWGAAGNVVGNVDAWSGIIARGNVTGDLHAAGNASCGTPCGVWYKTGTVNGDIVAAHDLAGTGGDVRLVACGGCSHAVVNGGVSAYRSLSPAGAPAWVSDGVTMGVQPELPTAWAMPAFTWNASNYSPTPSSPTVSGFDAAFDAAKRLGLPGSGFPGHYNVQDTAGTVTLGGTYCLVPGTCGFLLPETTITSWKMNDDLTIYTNRPVRLSADIVNSSFPAKTVKLVIVTTYGDGATSGSNGVEFAGNVTPPSSIEVLVVSLNDRVSDTDSTTQALPKGAVYGANIVLGDNWQITKGDFESVPGFSWKIPDHAPAQIVSHQDLRPAYP